MPTLLWKGDRPPRPLVTALTARGISITTAASRSSALTPMVVFTTRGSGAESESGPWIWLTRKTPTESRCRQAVMRGAYDVIALDTPTAIADVIARIEELFVADPPLPDAEGLGLVAESLASRRVLAQIARVAP